MGIASSIFSRFSGQTTYKSTGDSQSDQIEQYRQEANNHRQKYRDFSRMAKEAYGKSRGADAHSFSQQAHEHKDRMEEANMKAVDLLKEKQQDSVNNGEIDLHGFYVNEAIDFLKSVLQTRQNSGEAGHLIVVTGKGLHSAGGVAKIRPAVIGYLKKYGYKYRLSPGVVNVDFSTGSPEPRRQGCCVIS